MNNKYKCKYKYKSGEFCVHADTPIAVLISFPELRIVVVGRTGAGKSSLCNSILGQNLFKPSVGFSSESKTTTYKNMRVNGSKIAIVDTPGLFDTRNETVNTGLEIMKCLILSAPGPHAFLFVISTQRYTTEFKETAEMIRQIFGVHVLK